MADNEQELLSELEKIDRHWNSKSISAEWHPLYKGATMSQDILLCIKAMGYEQVWTECPNCFGTGKDLMYPHICITCKGTGEKCICPIMDNQEGIGGMIQKPVINLNCPVHGDTLGTGQKKLIAEEQYLFESIIAARKVQEFLWGFVNSEWGLEEWRRMFRKRLQKIDNIDPSRPHWKVELKKRLLQNTALGIALLSLLDSYDMPEGVHPTVPSNLKEYGNE